MKPRALVFTLYVVTLIAIITSSWVMSQWPHLLNWVTVGLVLFPGLLVLITIIARKRMN